MTKAEFRTLVTDVMIETLPKVNKRDRENFLDTLVNEADGQVDFDEDVPEYDGTNPDVLFERYEN